MEARHLGQRVTAGIRSSRREDSDGMLQNELQGLLEIALHSPDGLLLLPTVEVDAVVLNDKA
jgi:hypothetical protein